MTTTHAHPAPAPSTVPAPCDRCGQIERLRMGPGEALCVACGAAQLLDREADRHGLALAPGGTS